MVAYPNYGYKAPNNLTAYDIKKYDIPSKQIVFNFNPNFGERINYVKD